MNALLRHLELLLTAAGLLVIFAATAFFHPARAGPWQVAAVTATLVGVLHGVIFWLVRQRQRTVREQAFADLQKMLQDLVNNELAVIELAAGLSETKAAPDTRVSLQKIRASVAAIHGSLRDISAESLGRWQSRHGLVPPRGT